MVKTLKEKLILYFTRVNHRGEIMSQKSIYRILKDTMTDKEIDKAMDEGRIILKPNHDDLRRKIKGEFSIYVVEKDEQKHKTIEPVDRFKGIEID